MKTVTRIYEVIALLLVLGCLGQIFWGASSYDAQLSELKTAMSNGWQQAQWQAIEKINHLTRDVRRNGNPRSGTESIKQAQLLRKKTDQINQVLDKASDQTYNLDTLQRALKQYKKWLSIEFKDRNLPPIDSAQTLSNFCDLGNTTAIGAQALIGEKKLRIQQFQALVLSRIGAGDYSLPIRCCFGCQRIYTTPQATLVEVGKDYRADMYFGNSVFFRHLHFAMNNQPIAIRSEMGEVTFKTQGTGTKRWDARFGFHSYNGKDTTIVHKIYYEVK